MIKHLSKKKKILKISWNDHKSTKSRKLVKKTQFRIQAYKLVVYIYSGETGRLAKERTI